MFTSTVTIGSIKIGGELGANPTALAGSIFYDRHRIVEDPIAGIFDRVAARDLIRKQDEWSQRTGNPAIVDVIASSPQAMVRYLDFVLETTDAPIMVDGTSPKVRLAGFSHCVQLGVLDRVIYNSLSVEAMPAELERLRELGCRTAVLLCYNPVDFSLNGRKTILDAYRQGPGLLHVAEEAGSPQVLLDTSVIDLPTLGMARELIPWAKATYGLPVGTAAHNALGTWGGLKEKMGVEGAAACKAVVAALTSAWGGDFLIYGPMRLADHVFPAVATADACLGQLLLESGRMPDLSHPLFKIA